MFHSCLNRCLPLLLQIAWKSHVFPWEYVWKSIFALVRLKKRNKFRFFFLDVCILEIKTVLLARYCMYVLKICCEHSENLFGFCNIFSDYLKRSCGYSRWVWLTCWGYHSVCCQCTSPSDENILSAPHAWPAQTHHNKPVSLCACQT